MSSRFRDMQRVQRPSKKAQRAKRLPLRVRKNVLHFVSSQTTQGCSYGNQEISMQDMRKEILANQPFESSFQKGPF